MIYATLVELQQNICAYQHWYSAIELALWDNEG